LHDVVGEGVFHKY
jgi:hypothetical protein